MELDECIKGRRSVREYTGEQVSKKDVEAVLEAGVWAPTGMNRQPWKFIIIEDKDVIKMVSDETKKVVSDAMPEMAERMDTEDDVICHNAPALIFVCTEKDKTWSQVSFTDSVLAAQNMFLKAYELGLGTCYMGFISFLNKRPHILGKAGVPEGYELAVPFILGHPKKPQAPGQRNEPEILQWKK